MTFADGVPDRPSGGDCVSEFEGIRAVVVRAGALLPRCEVCNLLHVDLQPKKTLKFREGINTAD